MISSPWGAHGPRNRKARRDAAWAWRRGDPSGGQDLGREFRKKWRPATKRWRRRCRAQSPCHRLRPSPAVDSHCLVLYQSVETMPRKKKGHGGKQEEDENTRIAIVNADKVSSGSVRVATHWRVPGVHVSVDPATRAPSGRHCARHVCGVCDPHGWCRGWNHRACTAPRPVADACCATFTRPLTAVTVQAEEVPPGVQEVVPRCATWYVVCCHARRSARAPTRALLFVQRACSHVCQCAAGVCGALCRQAVH